MRQQFSLKYLALMGLVACAPAAVAMQAPPVPPVPPASPAPRVRAARGPASAASVSYIGVGLQEIDEERAKALHLKEDTGVEITRVENDSPAAKAGLQEGDVILEYNGQKVIGFEQFSRLVRETPAGREVKVRISRNGEEKTLTVKVGARPMNPLYGGMVMPVPPRFEIPNFQMPDFPRTLLSWRSATLGIEAESITGQLAQYFGVQDGVLVRSVLKDSAAEKAGMKAGDVILKVDDRAVGTPGEISAALRSLHGKKSVPITLMRDRKEMTLSATIDEDHPPE